jgi:hypothetical protein
MSATQSPPQLLIVDCAKTPAGKPVRAFMKRNSTLKVLSVSFALSTLLRAVRSLLDGS